jgi:pyruvate ferredoxin oxidoreductase gamma subunit
MLFKISEINMSDYSIIIYGRGGQGAKTLAQIIAEAGLASEYNIQAFPEYGPERRGAPVRSFVRLSKEIIRKHYPVTNPNLLIIMNDGLLEVNKEIQTYACPIIINTKKTKKELNIHNKQYLINASKIANDILGIDSPNIVLLGVFLKIFEDIKTSSVKNIIKKEFKNKQHFIEPNYLCLEKGYNYF